MNDRTLTCRDCEQAFTFTAGEQEQFASRGFRNVPGRCPDCRAARKAEQAAAGFSSAESSGGYARHERQMFPVICGQCGKATQVPFQPRVDRPVYCSDCFAQRGSTAAASSERAVSVTNLFDELQLRPATRAVLDEMGISDPTPIQAQAIPLLLEGRDAIGQARTGSGKTLAFSLPMVERCEPAERWVQALVLVPTRELAIQVGDVLGQLAAARRLRVTLLYGGRSLLPERQALARGAQIVVGTPGRTLDHLRQGSLSLRGVRMLVLDEGDEMLDRGFAPDVERILAQTPQSRQTALFSATMPQWIMATAARHLRNPVTVAVDREVETPPEIEHVVYDVEAGGKLAALRGLLDQRSDAPIIVFGRTKHGVKKLALQLQALGYPTAALQGNLSQNARERVMADFRSGEVPILLATNVAARGLDVDGIDQVINYELPESAQLFTHRTGRTGRMGRRGTAITFVTPEDAVKWREIERMLGRRLPRQPWRHGAAPVAPLGATMALSPTPLAAVAAEPAARRAAPQAQAANPTAPARASRPRANSHPPPLVVGPRALPPRPERLLVPTSESSIPGSASPVTLAGGATGAEQRPGMLALAGVSIKR